MGTPIIDLTLRPSQTFATFLLATYGATFLLLVFLNLAFFVLVVALTGYILLVVRAWRYWKTYAHIRRLKICDDNATLITLDDSLDLTLLEPLYLSAWLVILRFKGDASVVLPLFFDSADKHELRRLRVRLNCGLKIAD
jgi:hypothetical protein